MATTDFIIVRITPSSPVGPTAFRAALNNITITAWDKTVADTDHDRQLGQATGLVDPPVDGNPVVVPAMGLTGTPPTFKKAIIQHFDINNHSHSMYSVATAVIVVNPSAVQNPNAEYPTQTSYDVRLDLAQSSSQKTIATQQQIVDYNIDISSRILTDNPADYMIMPANVYLSVNVPKTPLPAGTNVIVPSQDGTAPSFSVMVAAIDAVLAKDSSSGASSLETMTNYLTTAQAQQIAAELTNNRQLDPPPDPPYPTSNVLGNPKTIFENMYTIPDSGGTVDQDIDEARTKFEGDRSSYYALRTADGITVANYVFSVILAVQAEFYSTTAPRALLEVPLQTNISHAAANTPSLALGGLGGNALNPPFTIPAAFFYALTTTYAISQNFGTRIKLLLTKPEETLQTSLQVAIDSGVLGTRAADGLIYYKTTLNSSAGVTINELQVIRRMVALQASVRNAPTSQVVPSANATVLKVVKEWLDFAGQDSDLPAQVWFANASDYLTIIMEIIAPGNEPLVSELLVDLRVPPPTGTGLGPVVQNVSDLLKVTETQWVEFFTRHSDLLPKQYILGQLKDKVHQFVQDITKVLFVSPPPQTGDTPQTQPGIPTLSDTLTSDILVDFLNNYSAFSLSGTLDDTQLQAIKSAALNLFSNNESVASFVTSALQELCFLYAATNLKDAVDPSKAINNALRFSYMEALHARGFTNADKVQVIPQTSFPSALSGTVAYPRAADIYTLVLALPSDGGNDGPEPGFGFEPVNAGNLTNCEPPCHLSPFGPIQYLKDLLKFSSGTQTLGGILATRRGDFSSLLVTEANLDEQLPVIDLINESLEALAGGSPSGSGAVYNTEDIGLTALDVPGTQALGIPHGLSGREILKALPQHSSPHLPLDTPSVYDNLKTAVTGPNLPYSQALDTSRTYLEALGTSRFDVMRTFSRDITELAQDASKEPADFQKELWRLPVRYDIALEYLGISPDEATLIYGGTMTTSTAMQFLGLGSEKTDRTNLLQVSTFIQLTGISYCDFLKLYRSGFTNFGPQQSNNNARETSNDGETNNQGYPECLPCCDENLVISFPGERAAAAQLLQLVLFVRLWKSIKDRCGKPRIPMNVLADITQVLQLFSLTNINPDFLRQLASLLMLQDIWELPWTSDELADPSSSQPDQRTTLLSLWSGNGMDTDDFKWAEKVLLDGIERHCLRVYKCPKRSAEWHKLIRANFGSLALLAGFDAKHTWYSKPTCTIRFVELLSKLYASSFTVGEILFLFTTKEHLRGDDPYPFTEKDESRDDPLNVPEDDESQGLWSLRKELLDVEVCKEEAESWSWGKIEATLHEMGYKPHGEQYSLAYFSEHFFPEILQQSGHAVPPEKRHFTTPIGNSSPTIWQPFNNCTPFFYKAASNDSESPSTLWTKLPLKDEEVLQTLRDLPQLNGAEANAVRALYLMPRTTLAPFALLFGNFNHAASKLIQETSEWKRFEFFQWEFSKFYKRCKIIAQHINKAVLNAAEIDSAECHCQISECQCDGMQLAWRILLSLIADENKAKEPWEAVDDSGVPPTDFQWDPNFSGSAFAALLGLAGTGIEGVYRNSQGSILWEEIRGGLRGWGHACDDWNTPIPTVLPSLTLRANPQQSTLATFKNGYAIDQACGDILSGGEPFSATWTGILLIEKHGCYHFKFSCPFHPHDEEGDPVCHCEKFKEWSVKIKRGQKDWTLLKKGIDNEDEEAPEGYSKQIPLRRGAYHITITFKQKEPDFDDDDDVHKYHTGFELSYTGADTNDCLEEVPLRALYIQSKDGPLWTGVELPGALTQSINLRYIPTLRDIRRTYQRAFKAVLFSHRFSLSGCQTHCERESEIGYLLNHPLDFEGTAYYWDEASSSFKVHHAYFDFNFLPVTDAYFPPSAAVDQRVSPSAQRQTALFDWFERIFDYTVLRQELRCVCEPPLWLVFYRVNADPSQEADQLVRYFGVEIHLSSLVYDYFATGGDFDVSSNILVLGDERWATRVWKSGRWLHRLQESFYAPITELALCRPALWASTPDPNVTIDSTTGNINLTLFVQRSCLGKSDANPRVDEVVRLNDRLRLHAREALIEYLGETVGELSDFLLLDVEAGISESTTRINDAIDTAQRLMQRAILGLEPNFPVDNHILDTWECKLATFDKWQASQRRAWYSENWVQWDESKRLEKSEGYRSLKKSLTSDVTTVATLARDMYWSGTEMIPQEPAKRQLSTIQGFSLKNQQQALDEGLDILGEPDHSARPTWLLPIKALVASTPPPTEGDGPGRGGNGNNGNGGNGGNGNNGGGGVDVPKIKKVDGIKQTNNEELPGADSLQSIPLWIQAALRLGTRFIRVAASNVPIGTAYHGGTKESSECCCSCGKDHLPVIDEYYFWLTEDKRFDPSDAPAPQNADTHVNVQGVDPSPDPNKPQIDPRTIQADPTSDWDAPTPQMLFWKSEPLIHLHWTRVHDGVLEDPRRSAEGIPLVEADLSNIYLDFQGRNFDSLQFSIENGDTSTGFRYDIATDTAIVIPEPVAPAAATPLPLPTAIASALAAFPYFLYFEGGAPLVPVYTFGTSLVIASSLRAECHYQASTKWLQVAFDPLSRDNTWMQCFRESVDRSSTKNAKSLKKTEASSTDIFSGISIAGAQLNAVKADGTTNKSQEISSRYPQDSTCCPTAPVKGAKARARAAALEYLETLLHWAESLSCRNSLEADQQALTLLSIADRVLGPRPKDVNAVDLSGGNMTVATFQASAPALNPRLVSLYDGVTDRISLIRTSLNYRRLPNGILNRDRASWGSNRRFDIDTGSLRGADDVDCDTWCVYCCSQIYRYSSILPKATQWISIAKSTGSALLSAFEKADSEALSALRTAQERQINELGLDVSKNQYRAADWDVQVLDKQMEGAIARLQYYQKLIQDGLNFNEDGFIFGTTASMASRVSASVSDGVGQGMAAVPDMWVGIAGAYGSPLQFQQMPMGVKMGTGFAAAARILNTVADISSSSAGLSNTQGGWDRREQDWQHQCDVIVYEIQQIKRQRLASRRRLEVASRELNNTQRRIEHSAEAQNMMRDKFSRYELYLYLQQENASLYRQTYNAAVQVAKEAEQAAKYELGETSLNLIPSAASAWNSLHDGMLAGEKLELAITALDRAYMNRNCREYELTKHVSLRLHFPAAFVLLKSTGYCEVDLPEWFFDLDYPGHYMRRIRNVSLTIPCVAGPYTGIHCRLQQLSSSIRIRPTIQEKGDCCHCKPEGKSGRKRLPESNSVEISKTPSPHSSPCCHDPRVLTRFAGTEAIATSSGQNDAGLFQVDFGDPRYLPFEYSGAVSRWRIELPPENNQFDFDSLSDLVMHINFTAREGGSEFKQKRQEEAQRHLPADGLRFFDIRHEMPEAWAVLRRNEPCEGCKAREGCESFCESHHCGCDKGDDTCRCSESGEKCQHGKRWGECSRSECRENGSRRRRRPPHKRSFQLRLTRRMFPFLNRCGQIAVKDVHLLLDTGHCGENQSIGTFHMRYIPPGGRFGCDDTERIPFVRSAGGIWNGSIQFKHPLPVPEDSLRSANSPDADILGSFDVECNVRDVARAWLLCHYEVVNGDSDKCQC